MHYSPTIRLYGSQQLTPTKLIVQMHLLCWSLEYLEDVCYRQPAIST